MHMLCLTSGLCSVNDMTSLSVLLIGVESHGTQRMCTCLLSLDTYIQIFNEALCYCVVISQTVHTPTIGCFEGGIEHYFFWQ